MSHPLQMTAPELLTTAIMTSTPIIIVEGNDDISIYENILLSLDLDFKVYASENLKVISSGKAGCVGVKHSLEVIEFNSNGLDYEKHILGIIDKDVSVFRGDDNTLKGLFVLKYYSIESHYITKEIIPYIVNNLTLISLKSFDDKISDIIFSNILEKLNDLYYISLEALRNACESEYESLFRYQPNSIHSIRQHTNFERDREKLEEKLEDLNIFAESFNLSKNIDSLRLIAKGKWILEDFISELNQELNAISNLCKSGDIEKCQFCINETYDKCLYIMKSKNEKNNIKRLLFNNVNISELDYIKDRMQQLG